MKESLFELQDIKLNYCETPTNGPEIVLLHGSMDRWQIFEPILDNLSSQYKIFAVELRGHGKSQRAKSYCLSDYLKDVVEFIQRRIGKPVILFGHSLEAMICLQVAAKYPELAQGLIIGDIPFSLESLKVRTLEKKELANKILTG